MKPRRMFTSGNQTDPRLGPHGAEAEYLRAFEIDPNSTTSNYFIAAFYAAIGEREKALTY